MLQYEYFMMYFISEYINISKYCTMKVQLFAMKIIEGPKIVLYRVLHYWLSALYVVLQTSCIVCHDNVIMGFRYFWRITLLYVWNYFPKMRKLDICTHCLLNTESTKWPSSRGFSYGRVYPRGGGTLIFSYIRRFGTLFWVKNFSKINIFGAMKIWS